MHSIWSSGNVVVSRLSKRLGETTISRNHGSKNSLLLPMSGQSQGYRFTSSTERFSSSSSRSSSSHNRVITTVDANTGIAHVVLNRPSKLNALDLPMFRDIRESALKLMKDRQVRVVILSGEGRAFCTGLDVPSIVKGNPLASTRELLERRPRPGQPPDDDPDEKGVVYDDEEFWRRQRPPDLEEAAAAVAATTNLAQEVGYLWRQVPVPVLCCLHGTCYGGGLQIALGADVRFATPTCQLSVMESTWGLIPDMSATVTLRELVRIDVAKELTFTGRIVTGVEAAQLGLVTRCVDDPLAGAEQMAQVLVQKSPDALRLTKQLYQSTWVAASEEYCLHVETDFQKKLLLTWNQMAAAGRNFGWKLPYFTKNNNDNPPPPPQPR